MAAALALIAAVAAPSAFGTTLPQMFSQLLSPSVARAAGDEEATADGSTLTSWESHIADSTQNIGRIWTDKSVSTGDVTLPASSEGGPINVSKGDSDFLIGLSALSSASNLTTTTDTPLDIVLVLDVSGSMDQKMATYEARYGYKDTGSRNDYTNTGDDNLVYVQDEDGNYIHIQWKQKSSSGGRTVYGWRSAEGNDWYSPKTSAGDSDPNHTQFYFKSESNESKLDALKDAVGNFLTTTAEENDAIPSDTSKHHVSVIKFAGSKRNSVGNSTSGGSNYTQALNNLETIDSTNVDSLISDVNSIKAGGATSADYGLQMAQSQLESNGRTNAQKVVVFFTDGEPNHQSGWDDQVASNAVSAASALKNDMGATVYTIGVISGANPNDTTSNLNAYMHAVSSNYKNASYTYSGGFFGGSWTWNLGDRTQIDGEDSAYYQAATNADELSKIFENIQQDMQQAAANSPTQTEKDDGAGETSGYITFTDQLGDYMQVDGFTSIVYADHVFENPTKATDAEGNTTYTFEGTTDGNGVYDSGDMSNIVITVKKGSDTETGDLVTVKVPASLIPLRKFSVKTASGGATMDVSEAYPIRIFYGVSLKDSVRESLANPDKTLQKYIGDHTEDGKVTFLSNAWSGGDDGNATATFEPASSNSFYYFTSNTPIYTDEALATPLTSIPVAGATYYYGKDYYEKQADGTVEQKTEAVAFDSTDFFVQHGDYDNDAQGNYYIKAGTARLTRVNDFKQAKGEDGVGANTTSTAKNLIQPVWDDINSPQSVNVALGNNGKLSIELPGTLAVTKAITVPDGFKKSDYADTAFTFNIHVEGAKGGYAAAVLDADGEKVAGAATSITFDANGDASCTLADGQTLYIYGLDDGSAYAVTEDSDAMPAGFSQAANGAKNTTGTIAGGETKTASFTNAYSATGTLTGSSALAGNKILTGRDGEQGDDFTFELLGSNGAPMPATGADADGKYLVTVDYDGHDAGSKVPFNFGDITFTKPGTYTYAIIEHDAEILGVTSSQAAYSVKVTVTDNGNGTLKVESEMTRTAKDNGTSPAENEAAVTSADFTNAYDADSQGWSATVFKNYIDTTDAHPLTDGMFTFKLTAVDGAPMPADAKTDGTGARYITAQNDNETVAFPEITFTDQNVGNTYYYTITEVAGNVTGMTYDASTIDVKVTVSLEEKTQDGVAHAVVKVEREYSRGGAVIVNREDRVFTNKYDPDDLVLTGDTAVKGTKTLTGRDSQSDEDFTFTLAAGNDVTTEALNKDYVVFGNDAEATTATATVTGLKNGTAKGFDFGSITFTRPGTYTFKATENAPDADADGMTWDRHVCTVTVKVEDKAGVLTPTVTYDNGSGNATDAAAFENTYEAEMLYGDVGGLNVTKTLSGRTLRNREFTFTIEGTGENADAANKKLAEADKSFTNGRPTNGVATMSKLQDVTFDQDDVGEIFTYLVQESVGNLGGVTYDRSQYTVAIQVIDDGDGTLHTVTTVTKVKNAAGEDVSEVVGTSDSSAEGAGTPTASFANSYEASMPSDKPVSTDALFAKKLTGRAWTSGDSFAFTLKPSATTPDAPMPAGSTSGQKTVAVTSKDIAQGATDATFGFGDITVTWDDLANATRNADGTYTFTYEVTEGDIDAAAMPGVAKDTHAATLAITVTDDGAGNLTAAVATSNDSTFTNTYASELDYAAAGGLTIQKTLNGRDMEGDQFSFTVTPQATDGSTTAKQAAAKLGISEKGATFDAPAATDGVAGSVSVLPTSGLTFTQEDAGKTFTYQVKENQTSGGGYTCDATVYTVTIAVADNGDATLTATTTVSDGAGHIKTYTYTTGAAAAAAAVIPFTNSYAASTDTEGGTSATISLKKELAGRPLAAGEFSFDLTYQGYADTVLKTVTNKADGAVDFGTFDYSTASIKELLQKYPNAVTAGTTKDGDRQWTIAYTAQEQTDGLAAEGVSATSSTVSLTVTVVDNGDGTMTATTSYPKDNATFKNTYTSTGEDGNPVSVTPSGTKVLSAAAGLTKPDIAGVYTFTLSSSDENAPMPKSTTAQNDAQGNVTFGSIEFSLDTLNKALGSDGDAGADADADTGATTRAGEERAYTFWYAVTESGSVAGVANDAQATRTFGYKVIDNGKGALTVQLVDGQGVAAVSAFTFTNTYAVESTSSRVTDQVKVTKKLSGRTMAAGEFSFELVEDGQVVATGTSAADGTVTLSPITYDEPGEHTYTLREVAGTAGGVSYDASAYTVHTSVTDNGDGTLGVTHTLLASDGSAAQDQAAAFANTYTPAATSVTVGAAKVLNGATLKKGQFSFELRDADGTVLDTAKNDASGSVVFDALTFTKAGTYAYTLAEVDDGQDGVTYDKTVYDLTVEVSDDGQGHLTAAYHVRAQGSDTYLTAAPVFANTVRSDGGSGDGGSGDDGSGDGGSGGGSNGLPQTGDTALPAAALAALALVGAAFAGAGIRRVRRDR